MNARHKLNAWNLIACAVAAGIIGGVSGSWGVFAVAFCVLLAACIAGGDIRTRGR